MDGALCAGLAQRAVINHNPRQAETHGPIDCSSCPPNRSNLSGIAIPEPTMSLCPTLILRRIIGTPFLSLSGLKPYVLCAGALAFPMAIAAEAPRSAEYETAQRSLAQGWNTWDVYSVGAQVLLPEGFTIRVGLKHNSALYADAFLSDMLIGRQGAGEEKVFPGPHTWNGSYTELRVSWQKHELILQTAHDGGGLVLLATPLRKKIDTSFHPPLLVG